MRSAFLMAGACALVALPAAADIANLPKTMIWTAYDLGSGGYAEASAIANALQDKYDTRVRIIPAGTSIGRLLPLTQGKATYGFLANEAAFAADGMYDFGVQQWGPQNIRIVIGRVTATGLVVAGDLGVKTIHDIKGKRLGYVKGNPSVNVKNDAYLAFAGLTRDDIEPVWFGSYNAMKTAVIANQLDAFSSLTTSANMREIEASPRGIGWAQLPPDDKEGWQKLTAVLDFVAPYRETNGAGVSEEKPAWLMAIRYPMVTTYASTSPDETYALLEAMEATFDGYKNASANSYLWEMKLAARPPYDAPAHEGTVRFLKDRGYWTAEDQAWQDRRMARMNKLLALWDEGQDEFQTWAAAEHKAGRAVDADAVWPEWWDKFRDERMKPRS